MTTAKDIMKISQAMNALAIASDSYRLATKKDKKSKDFIKYGSNSLIGSSFMKANADFIGDID